MGCCSSCCDKQQSEYERLPGEDNEVLQYQWEQDLVDNNLMKTGKVSKVAIVGLDGALRAWAPPDFLPSKQATQDIIKAFEGDTSGLVENQLNFGCDTLVSVPGKIFENKTIYGNDGHGGGTSLFKTKTAIIIVVFTSNPPIANRLGQQAADYMVQNDR